MAEEVNIGLSPPSTDQLHQSLRLLVRKIRAQLEVLTTTNKLKEEDNVILRNEVSSLNEQIQNMQSIITTKTDTESKLNDDVQELSDKIETESQRYSNIESELLKTRSSSRKEKEEILSTHQIQTEQLIKEHEVELKAEKQNFDNLQHQKLSLDTKLQEIMQSNDVLHGKLKDLQHQQQNLATMSDTEKNEYETKMEQLKTENIDYLSTIQHLKNDITTKDQEIHDIGMSLVSMQNDIQCLQSQSKSKNQIVNEYQSKFKQSEQDLMQYQAQYKQMEEVVDKLMEVAKNIGGDSFWNINDEEEASTQTKDEGEANDDGAILETVAHPFASSPSNMMIDAIDTEYNKRLHWMQMLPKRVKELQKQVQESHDLWLKEKETTSQITTYWKNKIKELNAKNSDLCQRMENLERMLDQLSSHNDRLIKENDSVKAEMHNAKFTSSAHEIYLQMKTKEEAEKTIELQQELDALQDDLLRKSASISKLEKSNRVTKQSMMEQKTLHQTEMLQLTNKLNMLTQLSQEEIQQTFHLTIQELQSILDQHVTPTEDINNVAIDEKKNKNDADLEHLLTPKGIKVPHITDSDVADDAEIVEAEHKLASYFARHKQRQQTMSKDADKKQSVSVEPIKEVNEDADNDCDEQKVSIQQAQIVEIVDDEDVVDEDENILTPPLQEEIPYIVFDDTLSMDPAIGNVSVSNIEVSNCSTRGNSTRGDQSPNSVKIDEPPTKEVDVDNVDLQQTDLENKKADDDDVILIKEDANDDITQVIVDNMDANDDEEIEATKDDNDNNNNVEQKEDDDDVNILHSLQPLQYRARSMGSVATTTTIDDLQSVDQSILAHDGSRDGSVVPELQMSGIYGDEADEELTTAEIDTVHSTAPPLPNASEYIATPDVAPTETIHSLDVHSVDEIHQEAHQLIDELQENLKEIQAESKVPTIVHQHESMDNQITNDDILGPLLERHQNHSHHDHEKQRKILNAAKAKWSKKVEEMIANTDAWFINEDGDIVLIYPEDGDIENNDNTETNEKKEEDIEAVDGGNDDDNNAVHKTQEEEEEESGMVENEDSEKKENDVQHVENVVQDKVEDDVVIKEKNEDEDDDNDKAEMIANDGNKNEHHTNNNVQKNENFFNSFRIF